MRTYPRNSPEAAARIVALALIADGHVSRSEIEALQHLHVDRELGLAPGSFATHVHQLCEDLLMGAYASGPMVSLIDEATLASLLDEVDAPALQHKVLRLVEAAAGADQHLADAEATVIEAVRAHWGLVPEPLLRAA